MEIKLYIAVLDEVPDFIVPTLVAHGMLGAHLFVQSEMSKPLFSRGLEKHTALENYKNWIEHSFKKCVVRVNQKEFDKIAAIPYTYLGHENKTLDGRKSCAVPLPVPNECLPNVLKFAKLWKPKLVTEELDKRQADAVNLANTWMVKKG